MAKNRNIGLDVRVLEDREVLFNFSDTPVIDRATGTFMAGWHSGGLEPADSTWALTREVSSNTTNLTGGQTATAYTAGAVTSTVDLIPGSPVVDHIEWPETVVKNGVLYRKHSSKVAKAFVARVHKFQSGVLGIMVTREKADLSISDRSTTTDPSARSVAINWKNGDDEFIAEEMFYIIGEDGTVTEVEEKVFKDVADLQAQLDAGTAFVPKASAAGLTAYTVKQSAAGDGNLLEFVEPSGDTSTVEPAAVGDRDGDGTPDETDTAPDDPEVQ